VILVEVLQLAEFRIASVGCVLGIDFRSFLAAASRVVPWGNRSESNFPWTNIKKSFHADPAGMVFSHPWVWNGGELHSLPVGRSSGRVISPFEIQSPNPI
jgi:hypothetical protein